MGFFESIGSFFSMIGNWFEMAFNGLITFIEIHFVAFSIPPLLSGYIAPIIYSSATVFVAVTVIRKVFGR